ncbi:uncharacterized protein TRIREDRAFT_112285 [Trichoderma reesei QM6a]|uniref:Predicted protein n=1 Tax=Hypocrea jecorina (strain QM6a) TaxID=431241 RepID=G0RWN7_HYPJQ|nr:uncharacterized protein TRIREDRAFT_112285 [Trichoderma reesei QM6a]EGR44384.1 predicted protein [Trichoderma reesei QM6a]
MPLVLDPRTSSPPQYTTLFQITTQQTTLATQTTVPTDTVYTPLPTTTDEPPSQTNTSGLSTQAKIGLESGIALGVLAVVVAIGLCAYGFSCRKSEKDSDTIRSYSPEPGTPQASMLDLPSQHITNLPQKAPLVFGHRINRDQSSNPLIYTAELDEGDTWDRYPRVSELQSGPYVKLPANARRAELESNHTRNPAVMHKIPRKEVQSHTHREPLLQSEVSVWPA